MVKNVPDEALVMKQADMKVGKAMNRHDGLGFEFQWTFALRPLPTGGTRLLVRERVVYGRRLTRWLMAPVGLVSFVMTRKMLLGIKQRASDDRVGDGVNDARRRQRRRRRPRRRGRAQPGSGLTSAAAALRTRRRAVLASARGTSVVALPNPTGGMLP